jgi:Ca2+-binding RTX toxin-like protein
MKRAVLVLPAGALLLALTTTTALAAIFVGTNGHDELLGTLRADKMYGKGGDDAVQGRRGEDLIYGGYGDDWETGDEGDDNLYDRHGSDYVYGNEGDDYINTKDGKRDHVNCGSGRDTFTTDGIDVVRRCEVPAI